MADTGLIELVAKARKAADGMRQVATGKAPDAETRSDAKSFARLADMLTSLSTAAADNEARLADALGALDRIANLKIRGASSLLGGSDWKKVSSELQAIAQEATQRARTGR